MTLRTLFPLLLASILAACGAGGDDVAEAHRLVDEGALLLDVRTPSEYESGHLPDAVNIPISELDGRMGELSPDRQVVVYCLSGGRSASAASALRSHGYQVYDLGAMASW